MKYMKIFTNWRIVAITALALLAMTLLAGDSDSRAAFFACKISGAIVAYATYRFAVAWQGKMPELDIFNQTT